jgi:hypothetical protein
LPGLKCRLRNARPFAQPAFEIAFEPEKGSNPVGVPLDVRTGLTHDFFLDERKNGGTLRQLTDGLMISSQIERLTGWSDAKQRFTI